MPSDPTHSRLPPGRLAATPAPNPVEATGESDARTLPAPSGVPPPEVIGFQNKNAVHICVIPFPKPGFSRSPLSPPRGGCLA